MTKFKVHFDKTFCRQAAELGISKKILAAHLKVLRTQPHIGKPIPQFPSFRVWRSKVGHHGLCDICYVSADEYQDIDVGAIFKAEDDPPPPGPDETLKRLTLVVRLVAMIIKVVKDLVSLLT